MELWLRFYETIGNGLVVGKFLLQKKSRLNQQMVKREEDGR